MTHRFTTAVRKADLNLKSVLFTGNFNIFPQVQPKSLELKLFLSQRSSHPPKGFDKPFNQRKGNKSGGCTVGGIAKDRKSSSLSGGADSRERDEENSKVGPSSGGKNKMQIFSGIAGVLRDFWVYWNHKDFHWKGAVDNFLGPRTHLYELVNAAKSTDPQIQYGAVNSVRKLLTSSRHPPIHFLISCNILPTLVDCLRSPNPALQFDALLALTKVVEGTSASEQTQAVIEAGAVPRFVRLLTPSPDQDICKHSLLALGCITITEPKLINLAISMGVLTILGTVSALMMVTNAGKQQIQMVIDDRALPKLVQLLNHSKVEVQEVAARAVWKIVNGSGGEMKTVLNCDALSHFRNLLNQPKHCKWALEVLAMVSAKNFATVQAIIDAKLIPLIVHHLEEGELQTQKAAVFAVRCINVSANTEQQAHLIDCGVIPPLCNLLNSNDSEAVDKAQDGILNILLMMSGNQKSRDKVCTLIKGCGGWDRIKLLQKHENHGNFIMETLLPLGL